MVRGLIAILLVGCGGAAVAPEAPSEADAEAVDPAPAAVARVSPDGSRLSLEVPTSLRRVAHALIWRDDGLDVRVADAQVAAGEERGVAEAYLAQLAARHQGQVTHRPAGLGGMRAYEATIAGEDRRLRTLMVWHEGAVSRVTVIHDPARAADAERVIDSVRFDPGRPIDPAAALQIRAAVPDGLGLIPVTNEQLMLRPVADDGAGAHAVSFPHPEPVVDIVVLTFPDGGRPPSDVARGQLLGSRFAGLELGTPRVTALSGELTGFAIVTSTPVDGVDLSLYGAYLESEAAVVLIRASVASADAQRWLPRFAELTLSIGLEG